jgi:hypothetical protein
MYLSKMPQTLCPVLPPSGAFPEVHIEFIFSYFFISKFGNLRVGFFLGCFCWCILCCLMWIVLCLTLLSVASTAVHIFGLAFFFNNFAGEN